MKAISLRFSDSTHQLITEEPRNEGTSLSAFIREAALIRAVWLRAQRGDYDTAALGDLYARARALLEAEDRRRR